LFGGPLIKFEYSLYEEDWVYYYKTDTETIERDLLTDEVHSIIHGKYLRIRLTNGTVTNIKYNESSGPSSPGQTQ